jgi:hypothetical protein
MATIVLCARLLPAQHPGADQHGDAEMFCPFLGGHWRVFSKTHRDPARIMGNDGSNRR